MNIALLGPSGAGKGTQAARLCSAFGLTHLSMGDLLRENLEQRTALGILARKYMDRGELVPDDVVDAMVQEQMEKTPPESGVVYDGYPRTPEQAEFLQTLLSANGRKLDAVFYLLLSEDQSVRRLCGRTVCRICHAPFHTIYQPPGVEGLCDFCGNDLESRPEDQPEFARARYRSFLRHIRPVLDFYRAADRLHTLDASGPPEAIHQALSHSLRERGSGAEQTVFAAAGSAARLHLHRAPNPGEPLNLVLLGGPGSGKGTQAEVLCSTFGLCHIASGDLFRDNLRRGTRLGELARGYMLRGELVPDDITEAMLEERLAHPDTESGFLLDGFPRTLPQAFALAEILDRSRRPLAAVLYLSVSDDELILRVSGRWICAECQAAYHHTFKPPSSPGICDKCGGQLRQREDDKSETVRRRLRTFHRQTEPLVDYYQRAGLLMRLTGEGDVAEVSRRLVKSVERICSERLLRTGAPAAARFAGTGI